MTKKAGKNKRYKVTYYKKHYIHEEFIAQSKEQAISLAWAAAPKDSWVEKVEELSPSRKESR